MSRVLRIDGVEVHHLDADGPVTAVLAFGVGVADEQVSTLGISHVIEHLALDGAEGLESDVAGETRMSYTSMSVQGTPERVVSRLAAICERIADISAGGVHAGELRRTCRILQVEGGTAMGDSAHLAEHLNVRLGAQGWGLGAVTAQFLAKVTPQEVAEWAADRFTADNAVLALHGPMPEGLRLPLPRGPRCTPAGLDFLAQTYPAEYLSGGEEPSLSFVIEAPDATSIAAVVLLSSALRARAYRILRQERGVVYDLEVEVVEAGGVAVLAVIVRCAEKEAADSMKGVLEILRSLRDRGATDEERRRAASDFERAEAEMPSVDRHVRDVMNSFLGTSVDVTLDADAVQGVTDAHLARLLSGLDRSLLVGFPAVGRSIEQVEGLETIMLPRPELVDGPRVDGEQFRPTLGARLGGYRLRCTVGDTGMGLDFPDGQASFLWEDVVAWGLNQDERGVQVLSVDTRQGTGGEIPVSLFRQGDRMLDLLRRHLPERLKLPDEE